MYTKHITSKTINNFLKEKIGGMIMHVIDQDTCVGCGACEATCPVGAISANDNGKFTIGDACIDCGACAGGCPVGAISAGE